MYVCTTWIREAERCKWSSFLKFSHTNLNFVAIVYKLACIFIAILVFSLAVPLQLSNSLIFFLSFVFYRFHGSKPQTVIIWLFRFFAWCICNIIAFKTAQKFSPLKRKTVAEPTHQLLSNNSRAPLSNMSQLMFWNKQNNSNNIKNQSNETNKNDKNGATEDAKKDKRNWLHTPDALVNGHVVYLVKVSACNSIPTTTIRVPNNKQISVLW